MKFAGTSTKTNFTIPDLTAKKDYSFSIKAQSAEAKLSKAGSAVKCKTKPAGNTFNMLGYGAKVIDKPVSYNIYTKVN